MRKSLKAKRKQRRPHQMRITKMPTLQLHLLLLVTMVRRRRGREVVAVLIIPVLIPR